MSFQYDQYLARHRANVKRGFDWLSENLPGLMTNTLTAGWNTEFAHDQSNRMSMRHTMHISMEIIALMRLYSDISEHGYFIFTEILIIGSTGFLFMTIWKMANWRPFWKCHTITSSR